MNTHRHIHLALMIVCFAGLTPTISRAQNEATPKPRLVVQVGHTGMIYAVSLSPNGQTIASGSYDGTIKLWDAASGQLLNTLRGNADEITSVCFSPDGKTLASGSTDNTITLWDTATGKVLHTLTGHNDSVRSVCFSPDGKTVASGSDDKMVKLWEVSSGKLLNTLQGHMSYVQSVRFSPDGRTIACGGKTASLWDSYSGRLLRTIQAQNINITSVSFSPDSKTLASGSLAGTVSLWEISSGNLIKTLVGHKGDDYFVAFSPDGKTVACGGDTASFWDAASGKPIRTLLGEFGAIFAYASPDGKTLVSGSNFYGTNAKNSVKLWDASSGKLLRTFQGHNSNVLSLSFSPNGRTLASGSFDSAVRLWDMAGGRLLSPLKGSGRAVSSVSFSPDGKTVAGGGYDHTINLWNASNGRLFSSLLGFVSPLLTASPPTPEAPARNYLRAYTLGANDGMATGRLLDTLPSVPSPLIALSFSSNSRSLACVREIKFRLGQTMVKGVKKLAVPAAKDMTETVAFNLWDVSGRRHLSTINTINWYSFKSASFSPNGKTFASGNDDGTVKLWDTSSGKLLNTLKGHTGSIYSVAFSSKGMTLASGGEDKTVTLYDPSTGRLLRTFRGHGGTVYSVRFSPDGKTLASGSLDGTIKLWDATSGKVQNTLRVPDNYVYSLCFSPDGKMLAWANPDGGIQFTQVSGRVLCTLYEFNDDGWVVIDPDGRFDGNDAGLQSLHYVAGLEPIDLAQLKSRYYEPGLLGKLLGFNKEPLRNVSAFDHVALYPEVKAPDAVPAGGKLPLSLTNRGGGIGRVQVFVNGKELSADARGPKPDPQAKTAEVTVDVSHAPGLVPGQPNTVKIVTWNAEGYLSSRGVECVYTPPGTTDAARPELWAIVGGISDYAAPELHLTYPAKDAADFAHALTLAAGNLFGVDKVHLTLLDTGAQPGGLSPTKANLQRAFAEARQAKPGDIFVVYLAGHGVALPGSGTNDQNDLYCYLTADATTGDPAALSHDLTLRQSTTVSSEELTDWVKQVPARKQVMVLDTCAAGAAAALLTAKRDVPSDQIRAIERLKDRTGFYVLMGCAADAASYETSRYRQGLLTYSLLKGMKGASLRDGQYVDVGSLFNYAVDEVPQLAQNIGGVQRPFVAAPSAGSFDMGELSAADRQAIPLAMPRPMVVRPELLANDDDLDLERLVTERFRDAGAAGLRGDVSSGLAFVDTVDFPGAVQPRGTYGVTGSTVTVRLRLRRNGVDVKTLTLSGPKNDPAGLASKITSAIEAAIQGLDHSKD